MLEYIKRWGTKAAIGGTIFLFTTGTLGYAQNTDYRKKEKSVFVLPYPLQQHTNRSGERYLDRSRGTSVLRTPSRTYIFGKREVQIIRKNPPMRSRASPFILNLGNKIKDKKRKIFGDY